jgi:hypothetical protein
VNGTSPRERGFSFSSQPPENVTGFTGERKFANPNQQLRHCRAIALSQTFSVAEQRIVIRKKYPKHRCKETADNAANGPFEEHIEAEW